MNEEQRRRIWCSVSLCVGLLAGAFLVTNPVLFDGALGLALGVLVFSLFC